MARTHAARPVYSSVHAHTPPLPCTRHCTHACRRPSQNQTSKCMVRVQLAMRDIVVYHRHTLIRLLVAFKILDAPGLSALIAMSNPFSTRPFIPHVPRVLTRVTAARGTVIHTSDCTYMHRVMGLAVFACAGSTDQGVSCLYCLSSHVWSGPLCRHRRAFSVSPLLS